MLAAVARWGPPAAESVGWLHELGHCRGLGHRTDPGVVMLGPNSAANVRVNATECNAYR